MQGKWFVVFKTLFFLIFCVVLLGTVIIFLGKERHTFKRTFILKTQFKSVAGLSQEAPVFRHGLRVGHVARCRFLKDGRIEVFMRIEARYHPQFRKGCYAKIVSVGILGDKAIDIVGGEDPKAPVLPYGSVIDSVEPFQLEDLASRLRPIIKHATKVVKNLAEITENIKKQHKTYHNIVQNIDKITYDMATGKGTLGALLKNKELYQETLNVVHQTKEVIKKADKIVSQLNTATNEVPEIVTDTKQTVKDLTQLIQQMQIFINRLDKWLIETEVIMKDLKQTVKQAKTASQELPVITKNLRIASEGAIEVIEAAKKSWFIRRYLKIPKKEKKRKLLQEEEPPKSIWEY